MVPRDRRVTTTCRSAPRARGDGPIRTAGSPRPSACSPHPRGWSLERDPEHEAGRLLPAPAGSRIAGVVVPEVRLLPTHVGIVPQPQPRAPHPALLTAPAGNCDPAPRGRGDGPRSTWVVRVPAVLPAAPAGMVPAGQREGRGLQAAPRARGDGPSRRTATPWICGCSPHPRGWSRHRPHGAASVPLLPAPAGMVPNWSTRRSTCPAAPRACGDGPVDYWGVSTTFTCSPRPRGWSPRG